MSRYSDEPGLIQHSHGHHGSHKHTLVAYRFHDQPKDEKVEYVKGLSQAWRDRVDLLVRDLKTLADAPPRFDVIPIQLVMTEDGIQFKCQLCPFSVQRDLNEAVIHWQVKH